VLESFGRDDALLNNDGLDQLFGGVGNDLFLSTTICDGDLLAGGADKDNASWAKLTGTAIEARIGEGNAGRPGASGPSCGSGETLDVLDAVDDLEGTSEADGLYGGPGANQLLGRAGADSFYGREGTDLLQANAGDLDPAIVCDADADTAWIDTAGYGEQADASCEAVIAKDPQNVG
jgi:Ca2+-binding RTX toxin-like protein